MDLVPKEIVLLILENLTLKEKYKFYMTCNKWAKYKPTVYFTIFESEDIDFNIVFDFIAICDSLHNAKVLCANETPKLPIIIGKRNTIYNYRNELRDYKAFIIEPTWLNIKS